MKILLNRIPSRRGSSVLVNGNRYEIDLRNVCRDVEDADAAKMLQANEWIELDRAALARIEARPMPRDEPSNVEIKARKTVIHPNKPVVIPETPIEAVEVGMSHPAEMDEPAVAEQAAELGKSDAEVMAEASEAKGPPPPSAAVEPPPASPAAPAEEPVYDPDHIPSGTEDDPWPDPSPDMKKPYLQEMAKAYEVEFADKATKAELCGLIEQAMYPPEDEGGK